MKQYIEAVTDELTGLPVAGAEVWIYDDDNNLATLYAPDGTTEIDNPLTTNEDGEFSFYAPRTEFTALVYYASRQRRRLRLLVGGGYSLAAQSAATAAQAALGRDEYANTSLGLAGTIQDQTFWVDNGDGTGTSYRHDAGPVATEIGKFVLDPTATGAAALIGATGGTVQSALNARPTASSLAAAGGAGTIGNQLPAGSNLAIQPVSDFINKNVLQPTQFAGTAEQQLARAINEAGASRDGGQGQTVQLPRGETVTAAPFNLANRVMLCGVSKRGSRIKAATGFAGSYMVTVDNDSSSMFDNPLEKLTIDCNDVASLGGVDSRAWQEGGGLRNVLIEKFRGVGVNFRDMVGGAALCRISDSEIFGSASNCVAGIRLNDVSFYDAFQLYISTTTLSGGGAAATSMPKAIDLIKGSLFVKNCHVENCTTGIYVDGAGVVEIDGFTGASTAGGVTNLVEIASTFTGTLKMVNCKRNGATNLVKDNRSGGFGTITGYDTDFYIQQEPTVGRGSIVASASIDGTGTPAVTKGFGIASITDNGTGDYTVTLTRSAQAASDFAVFGSQNSSGWVRCDLNGVNSVRIRTYNASGTLTDQNEIKLLVVRVA